MIGACLLAFQFGTEEFSFLWKNYLQSQKPQMSTTANDLKEEAGELFSGYYWPDSPRLPAWQIKKSGKIIPLTQAAKLFPIIEEAEVQFTKERVWIKNDNIGIFFFWRRNIVNDPRLTEVWQNITLGQQEPTPGNDCLWEIIGEAASANNHPNIVDIIINDMKKQGLLHKPTTRMTLKEIRWVMVEWSLPLWD